ncbi:PREDICTED: LOW QUALITY PROTEIN: uncharacterized protein C14orf79 homolog [Nanorana parkeri]|uniref:LOW QUALITY PROTEIN: uncharacterized protein C14orf79 homolog n=1 Tax=Nanorana parkeri TaxID=125878 RepID=UPI00085454AB|nr:PREDICTED: LOW QUALITY PROTEIN: uncharacterized protein C14orf79 homolog [Nanorana parkeri]
MKDVSDSSIGCSGDAEDKPLPVLPSSDNVCLEETPLRSSSHCEECDTSRALPEFSNTWGDFEGFEEFTPQSEQFYYADEALQLDSFTSSTSDGEHCTEQADVQDEWDPFNEEDKEHTQDCEQIFKLSFPVPSVEETSEDVKSLDTLLASTSNGDNVVSQLLKSRLWLDGDRSEKDILPGNPRCDWRNSKGCRDLMSLLCISAENTSAKGDEIAKDLTDLGETLHTNTSLIQTKLDVAPGCKQGRIFSYQLFLKKPSADVPISFLTFSGKKSFFSTNQMRFNF